MSRAQGDFPKAEPPPTPLPTSPNTPPSQGQSSRSKGASLHHSQELETISEGDTSATLLKPKKRKTKKKKNKNKNDSAEPNTPTKQYNLRSRPLVLPSQTPSGGVVCPSPPVDRRFSLGVRRHVLGCFSLGWPSPLLVPSGPLVGWYGVPVLLPMGDLLSGSREPLGNEGQGRWPILDIINTWAKPQPSTKKGKKFWRSAKGQH